MQKLTGFGSVDCLSSPELGLEYFNSLREEDDEPIYTYNNKYFKYFVRQSIKGGGVCASNQYYYFKSEEEIFKMFS